MSQYDTNHNHYIQKIATTFAIWGLKICSVFLEDNDIYLVKISRNKKEKKKSGLLIYYTNEFHLRLQYEKLVRSPREPLKTRHLIDKLTNLVWQGDRGYCSFVCYNTSLPCRRSFGSSSKKRVKLNVTNFFSLFWRRNVQAVKKVT